MKAYLGYLILAGIQNIFFSTIKVGRKERNRKICVSLCCLELIFLAGVRQYTVGADTAVYLQALKHYSGLGLSEVFTAKLVPPFDFELGYFLLTKLFAFFNASETVFLFAIATIIYIPLFKLIERYSKSPYISILVYFAFGMFSYSLGLFRQMIALSIVLCGMDFIKERKLLRYLLIIAFAMLFHTTALVALPLYFIYGMRLDILKIAIVPVELVLLLLGRQIVLLLLVIFPKYAGFLGGKYDVEGGSYLMLIILNLIFFALMYFRKKGNQDYDLTIYAIILAIFLQALGYSMGIFGRIVCYYSIYIMFAIPNLLMKIRKDERMLVGIGISLLLLLLCVNEFYGNFYVCPYGTVL